MKLVLACYGSRGEVEPTVAIGRELKRRGHDVRIAVPPDFIGFAQSAHLVTVACGMDTRTWLDIYRNLWSSLFRNFWNIPDVMRLVRELQDLGQQNWAQMNATLTSLAEGADLLFAGLGLEETAANVAEYYDIPFATLHFMPVRVNSHLVPTLPPPLNRSLGTVSEWLTWRLNKRVADVQRHELGLPTATRPAPHRIAQRGSLEIQAYDDIYFAGLAAEWAKWKGQRPIVGPLTMELATEHDEQAVSWIAAGTPPICFGFGSLPVQSPADTVKMIAAACTELGERALLCAGGSDLSGILQFHHIKVIPTVNYATVFPHCRAVVHHGGSGTTAAGLRAGVPTLILSTDLDQTLWGARVKRLKVGTARRFSATTHKSLVADLRRILRPDYLGQAREIATRMTDPAENIIKAADLIETFARTGSLS